MSAVAVTVYGGAGQIGGNKILLEDGQLQLLFDFGLNFEDLGRYYAEFLAPRASNSGTYDYLMMGLLPPLTGIYRPDAALAALDPIAWEHAKKAAGYREDVLPLGVLASHAHMDHVGLISFLKPEIPIVASAMTAAIAKSVEDSGKGGLETETVYWGERIEKEEEQALGVSRSGAHQLRDWLVLDAEKWSEAAHNSWIQPKGPKSTLGGNPARPFEGKLGPVRVKAFPVDHSIMGSSAYAVETSAGWVVYTGDLRLHGRGAEMTRRFAEEARALEPAALVCEGTRAGSESSAALTEADVRRNALAAVRSEKGLVVADFGPRNVERLITFLEVAEATKRKLVVLAKDAHLLASMASVDVTIPIPGQTHNLFAYKDREGRTVDWRKQIWKRFEDNLIDWEVAAAFPAEYILCLSYYDLPRLLDINPSGGSYIYSTSEPYTEEQEIDLVRLRAWLRRFNLKFVGDPESRHSEDEGFHASGHASLDELKAIIGVVSPKIVIPIHTQKPEQIAAKLKGAGVGVELPSTGVPIPIVL